MEKLFEQKLYTLMKYILQCIQLFACLFNHGSRESVVGMWTGMDWTVRRSNTGIGEIFPPIFRENSRPTQPPELQLSNLFHGANLARAWC